MRFTLNELNLIKQGIELWGTSTKKYMDEANPEGSAYQSWKRQYEDLERLLEKITTTEL